MERQYNMAVKKSSSGMVTGTMDGQRVTFTDASATKGYKNVVLDASPDAKQVSRSKSLQDQVNAGGQAPTQDQIKQQFPELKPGGLAYNGQITNPVETKQPSPTTIQAARGLPGQPAQPPAPADSQTVQKAFQQTLAAGQPAPQQAGQAAGMVQGALAQNAPAPAPQVPMEVENFFQAGAYAQPSMQELTEFLSPTSIRKELEQSMKSILKGQKEAAGLKLELANVERIMDGTEQDIRDEVEAVSGFATDSQVLGLTVGRNKTLLKRASMIQDQLNYVKDAINMDMTMYGFQKDMAQQEFQSRSFLLQYKQQNDQFIYKATQDALNRNLEMLGADGLYNATQGDPLKVSRIEKALGLASGGLAIAATEAQKQKALADQKAQLDLEVQKSAIAQNKAQTTAAYASAANASANAAKTRKETEMLGAESALSPYQARSNQAVIQSIDQILPKVSDKVTGKNAAFYDSMPKLLRPQEYKDFKALLEPLKSQIFTQTLQAMRDASKTGGAVGSVSEQEGRRFENALGALDNAQSAEQFKQQLYIIKDSIETWQAVTTGQATLGPDGNVYQIVNPMGPGL